MPFIGTQPEVGGYSVLDALTASATASYTLQLNSANFIPNTANQLLVSLNGVIQKPGSSFTVSGSTLTFSSALTSSDSIDFIIAMGEPLLIGIPSDGAVNTAQLANDAVTGAKIENNPTIAGNLTVSGNTSASGTLTSTGLITASAGMAVGGTGSANTLDDYEEGTFTPTFGGSGGNPTVSYSVQLGTYIKVGKMVQLTVSVIASGTPSGGSGDLIINGVPFTAKSGIQQAGSIAFTNNMNFGGGSGISQVSCNIEGGVAYLNVNEHEYSGASGMGRNPTNGITTHSGPRIVCSICYETA